MEKAQAFASAFQLRRAGPLILIFDFAPTPAWFAPNSLYKAYEPPRHESG